MTDLSSEGCSTGIVSVVWNSTKNFWVMVGSDWRCWPWTDVSISRCV
jgi:hypothetical protein